MAMPQCHGMHRIFLLFLSLVKDTSMKSVGFNTLGGEVNSNSAMDPYFLSEYAEDWTPQSSGFPDYMEVDDFALQACPKVCTCVVETILYCSRQGITFIGSRGGSINTDLKILSGPLPKTATSIHLGYNNITSLSARLFEDLMENRGSRISDLYLQNNQISNIHPDAFIVLNNLKHLDLSNNQITHITQNCGRISDNISSNASCAGRETQAPFLQSAPGSLISLNLNGNLVKGIPNYSFRSLPKLEVLRLSFNKITWINRKAFYGLAKLRVLQLRSNPLRGNTALKLGDILQHFAVQALPAKLDDSSQLGTIELYPKYADSAPFSKRRAKRSDGIKDARQSLRNNHDSIILNSLEDLDLGETNLARLPEDVPPSVRRLYLDLNRISAVPSRVLRTLKRLELLQLGGNRITHIADRAFASLKNLRVLDLSRNNLTKLTPNTFAGLLTLVSLRLYGNRQLSQLPRRTFWSLPQLRVLYLHNCNLTNLPAGPWLFRILALWLYGNPIDCNCQNLLSLMVRIYRPTHPSFSLRLDPFRSVLWDDSDTWKYQSPVKTTCSTPGHFRGYKIEDIRVSDLLCTYQDHYETEISRQIFDSRLLSSDYAQDQPAEGQISGITDTDVDGSHRNGTIAFAKKTVPWNDTTDGSGELQMSEVISQTANLDTEGGWDSNETTEREEGYEGTEAKLSDTKLDVGKKGRHTPYKPLPGRAYGFPRNIRIEDDVSVRQQPKSKQHKALNESRQRKSEGRIALYESFSSEGAMRSEYQQGFADFLNYDDGNLQLDMDSILRFDEEKERTLTKSDLQQFQNQKRDINEWKSYREYYGDIESSEALQFATHLEELRESGATAEEMIANLTSIYNLTDDYIVYDEAFLLDDEDLDDYL